jgi:hypothetical protein
LTKRKSERLGSIILQRFASEDMERG